jgi:hypothetical protein
VKRLILAGATLGIAATVSVTPASADFGIANFDAQIAGPSGEMFTQAAGHPAAITTELNFNARLKSFETPFGRNETLWPDGFAKDVVVETPAGLVGNPTAIPTCDLDQLAFTSISSELHGPLCSPSSQVGRADVVVDGVFTPNLVIEGLPIFNVTPPPGVPARFAFTIGLTGVVITLDAKVRSGSDYGVSVTSADISQGLALLGTKVTLWGAPAAPDHDTERSCPGDFSPPTNKPCQTDAPLVSFLRLPTSCPPDPKITGLTFSALADSYERPGQFQSRSFQTHIAPGLIDESAFPGLLPPNWGPVQGTERCDEVPFDPTISAQPTTQKADTPTGLSLDLALPQTTDPKTVASSDLMDATVTLPNGMAVNPAQADGLHACASSQIGLHGTNFSTPAPIHFTATPAACPDSSKIGTVSIQTPLLDHPVNGAVYLAAQNDNPFHSLLAMYLVAEDEQSGVLLKLPGLIEAGKNGQLTTTFENQPQLPFETLHLELFGGERAPLINPPTCGEYAAQAKLTPWARPDEEVPLSSSFQITEGPNGSPCPSKPLGFDPKLTAGTQSPIAGAFTPFNLRLTREDATQRLSGLSLTPPPGLLASLKGIAYCPDSTLASISDQEGTGAAQIANPSCPASSLVGTVTAGAGAGPTPFYTDKGRAYLAGPYKSAPLSLAVVAPAVAGPFDLGSVVVRNALRIDPETAKITALSDPIPTILHGIPLDLRDLRVDLDRPNFTLNPTSCDPMAVNATVSGDEGASANLSDHFQVGECGALAFKPKLTLRLKGKTKRTGHPALRATLTMPQKGPNANIAKAAVTLPHSEFLAQAHIRTICTRVQYAAGGGGGEQCPKGSVYGHARAFTPLLDQPLEGPVYLRSSNHPLPDLVASLGGQIHIDLVGRIDAPHGGIRNTFEAVPDAPVSKFVLTMQGGSKGLLENSTDLCKGAHRATVRFDGQNGKLHDLRPVVRADCGKGKKHKG